MKQRKSFLLRMDPALYEELEAWAQQDMRSLNAQIEWLLKDLVNRRRRAISEEESNPTPPSNA